MMTLLSIGKFSSLLAGLSLLTASAWTLLSFAASAQSAPEVFALVMIVTQLSLAGAFFTRIGIKGLPQDLD